LPGDHELENKSSCHGLGEAEGTFIFGGKVTNNRATGCRPEKEVQETPSLPVMWFILSHKISLHQALEYSPSATKELRL